MTATKPTEIEAIDAAIRDVLGRVRTFAPANVVAYQPPTPATPARCTVQVARRIANLGGQSEPIKPVPNVPIMYPGAGQLMIWWDLAPNDEVILGVPDRTIGEWLLKNGQVDPRDQRKFDLASAIAWPVRMTQTKGAEPPGGYLNIGTTDGVALLRVAPSGIVARAPVVQLGSEAAASPVALAAELTAAIASAVTAALAAPIPGDGGVKAFTEFGASMAAAAATFAATKTLAE